MEVQGKKEKIFFFDLKIEYKKNIFDILNHKIKKSASQNQYDFSSLSTIKINFILNLFKNKIEKFTKNINIFFEENENKINLTKKIIEFSKKNTNPKIDFLHYLINENNEKNSLDFWLIQQNLQWIVAEKIKNQPYIDLQTKIDTFLEKTSLLDHAKISNESLFFDTEHLLFFLNQGWSYTTKNHLKNKIICYFLNAWSQDLLCIDFNLFEEPIYLTKEQEGKFLKIFKNKEKYGKTKKTFRSAFSKR